MPEAFGALACEEGVEGGIFFGRWLESDSREAAVTAELVAELKQLCDGSCQVGYMNDPYPNCVFCRARERVEELESTVSGAQSAARKLPINMGVDLTPLFSALSI